MLSIKNPCCVTKVVNFSLLLLSHLVLLQPISQVDFGGSSFVYIVKYRQSGQNKCGNNDYCTERRVAKEGTSGRPGESNIIEYKVSNNSW